MTNPIADPLVEIPDTDVLSDLVLIEATPDGVATVTINRAAKRNAFNAEVIAALHEAFRTLSDADGVRLVFLTGAGASFSAGADLEWMKAAVEWTESENREDAMGLASMLKALHDLPQLTVALIDGPAFGGGAGLAAACDMAVATERSTFAFSEVKLGLTPATISPYVIRAIGARNAKMLFATGQVFDAAEAQGYGLVSQVVADAAAFDAVRAGLSTAIKACAPGAVADAKDLVNDIEGAEIDRGVMEETAKRIAARRVSEEGREGVTAFLEKRKPGWAE
ncbi:enoyl-CoA hydratase-related protein [Caulobacter sp. NIBR1757]|uniref:enoyl-CoA hydratase-related protein n=1 Tax=Caulobacter sp. NIBR1757 TaxID=3016000 RepID=UPI0022F0B237|nr:enoyl-CoA hydratase-related protein [Caulobacter sp. NIBR1757]WGM39308.1 1,4-dihydroxy-2-naphthoyl-CoA synthase [Caulobacter sp. NIBR1757]